VRDQVMKANTSIYQAAQSQPQYAGMGTTLVVCLFYDNKVLVAHLGDSRLYLLRDGKFKQVTRDHSLLQEQIDSGLITPEQAKNASTRISSPRRSASTRASSPRSTSIRSRLETSIFFAPTACATWSMTKTSAWRCRPSATTSRWPPAHLVQMANDNGGRDNVSVILVRVLREYPGPRGVMAKVFAWLK